VQFCAPDDGLKNPLKHVERLTEMNCETLHLVGCKEVNQFRPISGPRCPEGSRKLRFPDLMTTARDGDKVVSLTYRPPLPPVNASGTHFC